MPVTGKRFPLSRDECTMIITLRVGVLRLSYFDIPFR